MALDNPIQWILGIILILSALGVILARQPVHAALAFLVTLLTLAAFYLQLSASFIAVMQVLVYAGAILVIFMFVIILFQDAHQQIAHFQAKCKPLWLFFAASLFLLALILLGGKLIGPGVENRALPEGFGTVESIGNDLYLNFFFPFEAVILLFLVAVVGSHYIGKKER